jgi:hypothetical protein
MTARLEACIAAAFSMTMRWYSAALQVPCAIMKVRRQTVSQDANVNWAIIVGRLRLRRLGIG